MFQIWGLLIQQEPPSLELKFALQVLWQNENTFYRTACLFLLVARKIVFTLLMFIHILTIFIIAILVISLIIFFIYIIGVKFLKLGCHRVAS